MDLYRKLFFVVILIMINVAFLRSEIISPKSLYENVNFHLTFNKKSFNKKEKSDFCLLTLLIDNKSQDTVYIRNFNKCIFNKFNHIEEGRAFSWELLTLSDQLPEEIVLVLPHNKKLKLPEKNTDIVVLPNSLYVTEIEIKQSSVSYPAEGYYKLCLYYEALKECVAELVVWND